MIEGVLKLYAINTCRGNSWYCCPAGLRQYGCRTNDVTNFRTPSDNCLIFSAQHATANGLIFIIQHSTFIISI
jgi:hypothetical protein